ncbi:hypothetical protein I6G82_02440 [Lysinibacillus macroides]|uniref:Uncharacterized protein n=1 Tax=Lysinibacillus macroides TaxID=33935 RepID=A0A0M9DJ99_9BACI|nr:hypothetical protein [Lysinibacillus macroides]KOY81322.1 hypothetical protein ADM90_19525 [Lysinibacillus macroides]QPR68511.1 hypothetical protein I6G82_02440 [Lysinibacillus macroides]
MEQRLKKLEERVAMLEQHLVELAFHAGETAGKLAATTVTSRNDENSLVIDELREKHVRVKLSNICFENPYYQYQLEQLKEKDELNAIKQIESALGHKQIIIGIAH